MPGAHSREKSWYIAGMKNSERGFIKLILVGVMLFIAAGAVYALGGIMPATEDATPEPSVADTRPADGEAIAQGYEWIFTDLGTDDFGMPRTIVGLMANGRAYEVGEFDGSCAEMDTDFLPGQKSKVGCWWAGGGNEIGIFEEGGRDVVKVGAVGEGDAETEGFRGNFETKVSL